MNIKTKEVKKKKAKKCRRTNKRKLVYQEFGQEVGNIFTEALGEVKIEEEAKKLKAEGKTLDDFTEEEIVNRYINWTVYEVIQLKKYMRGEKCITL